MNNKKIFVIGFNKTGTTSFHNLFKKVNIKSIHTGRPVLNYIHKYNAFSDGYHVNFHKYYNAYPNSLFILNTRPIEKWLLSRYKHGAYRNFKPGWCWPVSDEKTNAWITGRENHFRNILNFFKDKPNQLFIINIEKNGWEKEVLQFIKKGGKNISTVHSNKRTEKVVGNNKIKMIKDNIAKCLKNRGYTGKEILFKDVNLNDYKYKMFL